MNYQYIIDRLPYKSSFRFVDEISVLTADKVVGGYTLKPDAFFYEDHFPGNPVTPGAIITEIMAQIGLVVLGIFIVSGSAGPSAPIFPLLTSADVDFLKMVPPGQKVTVISDKIYFRFDKLKCRVIMQDAGGEPIAKGILSGMIRKLSK
ncbi:MAG TPA: hydroxymyristoyl-ACP dehydratase [Puia sp.]|jgi:3-hydroxyacyl-[acyl-carrier-protein] dehydratase|nr:hydroxymyristoyl-ACP dehydratase [Puia sp.]